MEVATELITGRSQSKHERSPQNMSTQASPSVSIAEVHTKAMVYPIAMSKENVSLGAS